jgi:hypothetical protein
VPKRGSSPVIAGRGKYIGSRFRTPGPGRRNPIGARNQVAIPLATIATGGCNAGKHFLAACPRRLRERIVESPAWCVAYFAAGSVSASRIIMPSYAHTASRKSYSKKVGVCCTIHPRSPPIAMTMPRIRATCRSSLTSAAFPAVLRREERAGGRMKKRGTLDRRLTACYARTTGASFRETTELSRIKGRAFRLPDVSLAERLAQFQGLSRPQASFWVHPADAYLGALPPDPRDLSLWCQARSRKPS